MGRWKTVKVRQEIIEEAKKEVEKSHYPSLSEFVSEAIRHRLRVLAKERIPEYLERDRRTRILQIQTQSFYTPKHIWAEVTPQRNVKMGITDFFQSQLKEIVYIHTEEVGEKISEDDTFGMIDTWWYTYGLYSPLSGKIVSVNKTIIDEPFTLHADPHQWIVEVQPEHSKADSWMNRLLSLGEYANLVTKLEGRLH